MNRTKFLSAFLFMLLIAIAAQAQGPKLPAGGTDALSKQVLGILDSNTSGLGLTEGQQQILWNDLLKLAGGSGTNDSKKASILGLKNKRLKFLTDLTGNELTQKCMGNVLKAINPLKSKLGLAALGF